VKGSFRFLIEGDEGCWLLDLKAAPGRMVVGDRESKADVTLMAGDDDFVQIVTGKMNAQQAFMKGRLKIKGNMALAMKLEPIMKLARKKANL
jgi:putative sterol carrier protein